jgi:phage baseplate assembly protein W
MRSTFGSYLRIILFDSISRATGFRARAEVFRAISVWEPRVAVQDVLFELDDTTITLHVTWRSSGNLEARTTLALPRVV